VWREEDVYVLVGRDAVMKDWRALANPCRADPRPEHNPFINRLRAYSRSFVMAASLEEESLSSSSSSPIVEGDDDDVGKQCSIKVMAASERTDGSSDASFQNASRNGVRRDVVLVVVVVGVVD